MLDLKTRGTMAASRFLASRGYDVLEENWKGCSGGCAVIALDLSLIHIFGVPVHVRFPSFCGEVLCGRRAEVYGPCMRRL